MDKIFILIIETVSNIYYIPYHKLIVSIDIIITIKNCNNRLMHISINLKGTHALENGTTTLCFILYLDIFLNYWFI